MSCIPIRWLIALTLCFIGVVTYLTRININNAIVDMVIQTNKSTIHPNLCPARQRSHKNVTIVTIVEYKDDGDRFDWSPETQGLLLGSFFWTYFLFHTPHGYIAGRFGGRIPICIALLVSGIISLASPAVAHLPSVTYLILLRSLMGVFQAGIFPGLFVTACNWVPVHERSTILAVNEAGPSIGLILMQFLSGYLMKAYSWTILFYAPGAASLVAFVFVLLFLRNRPEEHPLISQQELEYIRRAPVADEHTALIGEEDDDDDDDAAVSHQISESIPWIGMLTNKSVAAFLFFKFARALAFYLITAEMPTYFHTVLQEDLVAIGIITSSATGITLISLLVTARAADYLIEQRYLTRTKTRKLFCLFAGFANAVFVMLIPALRCNRLAVIAVFFIGAVFYGCQTGSDTPLPAEMTTKFHAVLYAIGIVFANIPGFLSPMLTGFVLGSIDDQWLAWSILFYSTGGLLIFATILFMMFVSAKRQDFDFSPAERRNRAVHTRSC